MQLINLRDEFKRTALAVFAFGTMFQLVACGHAGSGNEKNDASVDSFSVTPADSLYDGHAGKGKLIVFADSLRLGSRGSRKDYVSMHFNTDDHTYMETMFIWNEAGPAKFDTVAESGPFTIKRGFGEDKDAVVYVLHPGDPHKEDSYLELGDSAIVPLTIDGRLLPLAMKLMLRKR